MWKTYTNVSFDLFFFNKIYPSHVKAVFRWRDQAVSLLLITNSNRKGFHEGIIWSWPAPPFRWDYSPTLLGYRKELNVAPVKKHTHYWVCCIYKGPVQPNTSLSHNSVSFSHSSIAVPSETVFCFWNIWVIFRGLMSVVTAEISLPSHDGLNIKIILW